jgi:hypothetical protein
MQNLDLDNLEPILDHIQASMQMVSTRWVGSSCELGTAALASCLPWPPGSWLLTGVYERGSTFSPEASIISCMLAHIPVNPTQNSDICRILLCYLYALSHIIT